MRKLISSTATAVSYSLHKEQSRLWLACLFLAAVTSLLPRLAHAAQWV